MDQAALLELHRCDGACRDIERRLAALPGLIAALREEEAARARRDAARGEQLAELADAARRLELDLKQKSQALADKRARMVRIQAMDALAALEREIAALEKAVATDEDRLLEKIEAQEILARESALRHDAERESARRLAEELARLEAELAEATEARARFLAERARRLAVLDAALRHRYERAHRAHGFTALSILTQGACGGCGVRLPPQDALDLRGEGRVAACPGCGRLLFWMAS